MLATQPSRHNPLDFVYVFNHVPRTGGAALGALLGRVLNPVYDYPGRTRSEFARWLKQPVRLSSLRGGDVLLGHYTARGATLFERYPGLWGSCRFRLLTLLRDPSDWSRSMLRQFGPEELGPVSPDDQTPVWKGLFERTLNLPAGARCAPLDAYWFVSVTERLQQGADDLLDALGRPHARLTKSNTSGTGRARGRFDTPALGSTEVGSVDVGLYQAALARSLRRSMKEPVEP